MYKKLTPNLMVDAMNRTLDFYINILGFDFVMGVPENSQEVVIQRQPKQDLQFSLVKSGNVEIMFQSQKSLTAEIPQFQGVPVGASSTFYFDVENVKGLYAKIKGEVALVKELETKFYGKDEFYIRDPEGYILCFAGSV
jgi:uncharacterized glyoxalase superfamily protein PhnB